MLLLLLPWAVCADHWALLVAGSQGWFNYRHQADVFHAYQLLTKVGGFPRDRIITMAFDDVAHDSNNPYPGRVFHHPTLRDDVYGGVRIDYRERHVHKDTFLKVLGGDSLGIKGIGSERVIESTANDSVFVFFSGHGGTNFVLFPSGPALFADELNETLTHMSGNQSFGQLVFYLESCQGGSMFSRILPHHEGVFAMSAANVTESSYAIHFDWKMRTFLGNHFSVAWIEDSEKHLTQASYLLKQQVDRVKDQVSDSHPQQYGQEELANIPLGSFQAYLPQNHSEDHASIDRQIEPFRINARDALLFMKRKSLDQASSTEEISVLQREVEQLVSQQIRADSIIAGISSLLTAYSSGSQDHQDFECLRAFLSSYETLCGPLDAHVLHHSHLVAATCNAGVGAERMQVVLQQHCVGVHL